MFSIVSFISNTSLRTQVPPGHRHLDALGTAVHRVRHRQIRGRLAVRSGQVGVRGQVLAGAGHGGRLVTVQPAASVLDERRLDAAVAVGRAVEARAGGLAPEAVELEVVAGHAPAAPGVDGEAEAARHLAQLVPVEEAAAEEAPELAAELLAEEVVRDDVDGRVEDDEEVGHLVEREVRPRDHLHRLEGVDHARDEGGPLADEEDDDDADEHDGGVVAVLLLGIQHLALQARHVHGVDEEGVEDDEGEEGQAAHADQVHPRVHDLAEDLVLPDLRHVDHVDHLRGVHQRQLVLLRVVLQELGDAEDGAGDVERHHHLAGPAAATHVLRLEGVADHDVAVDGEGQRQPDGRDLEDDGRGVHVGEVDAVHVVQVVGGVVGLGVLHDQEGGEDEHERVAHGQRRQVGVGGGAHGAARQHGHGQTVGHHAETADDEAADAHQVVHELLLVHLVQLVSLPRGGREVALFVVVDADGEVQLNPIHRFSGRVNLAPEILVHQSIKLY